MDRLGTCIAVGLVVTAAACATGASSSGRVLPARQDVAPDASPTAIVRGIDHFFAASPMPEPLYRVFRDTLGLPEVYPFRSYGSFASGVVSMGNVLFEVVTWDAPAGDSLRTRATELIGIAFEPSERLPTTLARLRDHGLAYQAPESVTYAMPDSSRALGYINVGLDGPGGLPPARASIFINDNLGSPQAASRRSKGANELVQRAGGPLGVLGVRELVIGVERRGVALAQWRRLLESPAQESRGVISFPAGPAIRFVEAPAGRLIELVVQVRSLEQAERFLASKGMLRREHGHVLVALPLARELRMRLVQ